MSNVTSSVHPGDKHTRPEAANLPYRLVIALHWLLAAAPLAIVTALYVLSWRGLAVLGHWPRPWIDDPKLVAGGPLYDLLYGVTFLLLPIWISSLFLFPLTSVVMWRAQSPRLRWLSLGLFVAGWVLVGTATGDRMAWLMD
jgi:hypothetical protein